MATQPILAEQIDAAFTEAIKEPEAPAEPAGEPESTPEPSTEPQTTPDEPTAEAPEGEAAEPELLSKEEEAALLKNPATAKALKEMKAALTRKTMALADERRALAPLQEFSEKFQADPKGTLKALMDHTGIRLDEPAPTTQAQTKTDKAVELLKSWGFTDEQAAQQAPALRDLIKESANEAITPIRKEQEQLLQESVQRETKAIIEQFEKRHPDYKKHEAALSKVMKLVSPNGDISEMDYLENCWKIATFDIREADQTKKVLEKVTAAAKKSESSAPGVPAQRVSKAAPKFESLNDAIDRCAEDASQGIVYESE